MSTLTRYTVLISLSAFDTGVISDSKNVLGSVFSTFSVESCKISVNSYLCV